MGFKPTTQFSMTVGQKAAVTTSLYGDHDMWVEVKHIPGVEGARVYAAKLNTELMKALKEAVQFEKYDKHFICDPIHISERGKSRQFMPYARDTGFFIAERDEKLGPECSVLSRNAKGQKIYTAPKNYSTHKADITYDVVKPLLERFGQTANEHGIEAGLKEMRNVRLSQEDIDKTREERQAQTIEANRRPSFWERVTGTKSVAAR